MVKGKQFGKLDVMIGLEVVCGAFENYFSPEKEEESNVEFDEFSLKQMLADFTDLFFEDSNIKNWTSKSNLQNIPMGGKYALQRIGTRIKSKSNLPDEEKAFNYIVGYLGYFKHLKTDKTLRDKAYKGLHKFFGSLAGIAEQEANKLL